MDNPEATAPVTGPYLFLDYFREADRNKFAGRDRDIAAVVSLITRGRTSILYGRSGLGKTSLLLAGVVPVLKERGFVPVYVRTLESPVNDFLAAVRVSNKERGGGDQRDLDSILKRLTAAAAVVIFFDQFEEFFIRFKDKKDERRVFIDTIVQLVENNDLDVRIVFSLREDYLAALDDFREALPDLFSNSYRLQGLTAFGARQAILQPLLTAGVDYDRKIIAAIVDELEQFSYDPPLLQILCAELYRIAWERSGGHPSLGMEDFERVGGVLGIFHRYLDRLRATLPKHLTLVAKVVLDALITREHTKQAVIAKTLTELDFVASLGEVDEVLGYLVASRLGRRDQRGDVWYELAHERLVEIIREWLELDREYLQFRQAKINVSNISEAGIWRDSPAMLLQRGVIEDVVKPYRERLKPQMEFLVKSCIVANSDELLYWAERYGLENSRKAVTEMLSSENEQVRASAARSANQILESNDTTADIHLMHAINDSNETVRRNAGAALAAVAKEAQLKRLREAIDSPETHRNALEVLADLYGEARS